MAGAGTGESGEENEWTWKLVVRRGRLEAGDGRDDIFLEEEQEWE